MTVVATVWWWVAAVLVAVAGLLFLAKVGWNFAVPYALLRRRRAGNAAAGISLHPLVELTLLALAVVFAAASGQDGWFEPVRLALAGIALAAVSYLHLFLIPALFFRPRPDGAAPGKGDAPAE